MKKYTLFIAIFISVATAFAQYNHHDSIDVHTYDITLDVSDFSTFELSGHTDIVFKTTGEELNKVAFDLFSYNVDSVFFNGEKVTNFNYNDTVVAFYPENSLAANQKDTCQIFYHGYPPTEPGSHWGGVHTGTSMIFNMGVSIETVPHGFGRAWFPCIDNFTDRAHYNINIITKDTHRAIATGILINSAPYAQGKTMWEWSLSQTSPTYLVSFAVGDFTKNVINYEGTDHDFPIEIYALPDDSAAATNTFTDVPEMLALYENYFGQYYWDKAGYTVVSFSSGAMEHLTNIAYPKYALSNDIANQTLVAHELSHHWFGNQVTCNNAGDMWLNEGWASYCEALYMEHFHGEEAYHTYVNNNHRTVVNSAHNEDGGYWALSDIPHSLTYSTTVYDKGALVAHNLRQYMGDELFFPAIKNYLSAYAEDNATTAQFRDHLSDHSGIDLSDFFDNWVYHGGFPQYSIDSVKYMNDEVVVGISQESVGREYIANSNKLEVGFIDENWEIEKQSIEFDGKSGVKIFTPANNPVMTILDPDNKTGGAVLSGQTIVNDFNNHSIPGTDVTFMPQELSDSVFLHISQMWQGPKDTGVVMNGFEVLNMSWWRIDYHAIGTFNVRTKFNYSTTNLDYLDVTEEDTLLLVHRTDSRDAWHEANHSWYGNVGSGSLILEEPVPGDFAIAVWRGGSSARAMNKKEKINVYPNPSSNGYYIELPQLANSHIVVYSMDGKEVDQLKPETSKERIFYDARKLIQGQYTLRVINNNSVVGDVQIIKND